DPPGPLQQRQDRTAAVNRGVRRPGRRTQSAPCLAPYPSFIKMLTIAALASAYRARQTTPSATLRDLLDRIAASPLNCFISVDPETVMRQAADADAAFAGGAATGALHGIPVAVKDLIDVAGMPTTMGSQQYA